MLHTPPSAKFKMSYFPHRKAKHVATQAYVGPDRSIWNVFNAVWQAEFVKQRPGVGNQVWVFFAGGAILCSAYAELLTWWACMHKVETTTQEVVVVLVKNAQCVRFDKSERVSWLRVDVNAYHFAAGKVVAYGCKPCAAE